MNSPLLSRALALSALVVLPPALSSSTLAAERVRLEAVGIRGAFSATSIDDGFYQAEAWSRLDLPWSVEWESGWRIQTGVEGAAGLLTRGADRGFVGSLGPTVSVRCNPFPLQFICGSSPTLISRQDYGQVNFGVPVQFTSHAGFAWVIAGQVSLTYRFQHMSNASLDRRNPGLDLHAFALGYRF